MKSFLIHRISKPNFLRRFGVPCGRAGKRKKREKRRKNSRKQTFLIFLRFLRNFSYRVKRLFLDSTYPRNFFFSFLFFPFSFDEKHSESKEREREEKNRKSDLADLPDDFFDCYEGWVDGSTRVSGIRRCICPFRSYSCSCAAIESLYGATLLHVPLLLNREKIFSQPSCFALFFVGYFFFFFFRILMKIVRSFSPPVRTRLKQNESGQSNLIVL